LLFSHGPNNAFLVPDLCRATERIFNNISADITDDTIENDYNVMALVSAIFRQFASCFGLFDILG